MPFVRIEQDCRVLGYGFSPGEKPVEVDDAVADAMVKEKLGVVVEASGADGDNGSANDAPDADKLGNENN